MVLWNEKTTLQDAKEMIISEIKNAAGSFVAVGYYLKHIRNSELYKQDGYDSIWEFAQKEFGVSRTWASRWMSINDRFSKDGNSPVLLDQFSGLGASKLAEMLSLSNEQVEKVNENTTVAEIRELKKPIEINCATSHKESEKKSYLECAAYRSKKCEGCFYDQNGCPYDRINMPARVEKEKLSAVGEALTIRTKDSSLDTKGCGSGFYSCYCCGRDCGTRQEARYCVQAALGNPYPCTTMNVHENLVSDMGDSCMFVNLEMAYIRHGDKEPVPCCKECVNRCGYACNHARIGVNPKEELEETFIDDDKIQTVEIVVAEVLDPGPDTEVVKGLGYSHHEVLRAFEYAKEGYEEHYKCEMPEKILLKKMIVKDALWSYYQLLTSKTDDDSSNGHKEQPELPLMRNNDQRKEFLDTYETWPIWIDNTETGERYYRYNLPDGTSIVIKGYLMMETIYDYKTRVSQEVEEYRHNEKYILEPDKHFKNCETTTTELIEHLKKVQRK